MYKTSLMILLALVLFSCWETNSEVSQPEIEKSWSLDSLNQRANDNIDSGKWDTQLFGQDIETYQEHAVVFQSFPLNKSPFPVAEYDYAVSSRPVLIETDGHIFKGVRIGEFEKIEDEKPIDRLTLLVMTDDKDAEENTLVESRNYPYLTAQGYFKTKDNKLDWVFSASPDGYSTLMVNMKLFDLRFGETIVIYPGKNGAFIYDQFKDSPNNYQSFDEFKAAIKDQLHRNKSIATIQN